MVINPNQLLKRLEPSIRPDYLAGRADEYRVPFEAQAFDQMLAMVSRGRVAGRPVEVGFEMDPELDSRDMQRIAAAADLAEAGGARTAILLLDGRGLLLDVGGRELTAEMTAASHSAIAQIDAAVYVAREGDESGRDALTPGRGLPGAGLLPPSVAQRLEKLEENGSNASFAD